MTPIEFPQANRVLAEEQPEYHPLPCYQDSHETISCWRLSLRERFKLIFGAQLWLRQWNFRTPLQPQLPTLDFPFIRPGEAGNDN